MDWNMKAASWDLAELDEATGLPSIETIDGSSRFRSDRSKGEFSVDLKLGQVGNSSSSNEPAVAKWKDVGGVSKVMTSSSSSSSGSSKRARAINNGTQPVSCLVDGCNSDLSNCRDYHRRHKVCELHSKTPVVTIGGHKQRFCQQCSRFHSLEEFDEGKRSCRKRLDGHNRRRRKPQAEGVGRSGSFLSNYQGTHLLPFSSSHVYPSTAMAHPAAWNAEVRLHHNPHHQLHHLIDHKQDLFLGSSSSSYSEASNNDNSINTNKQQLACLQGDNSASMENNQSNNQQALPPPASVCPTFLRPTPLPAAPLYGGDHHDSHCALSLLSSPQTRHTSGNGLSQVVQSHQHQQAMSILQQQQNQPLGLSLHDHSLEAMDPVLGHHCPTMYNMNETPPPPFPFHWE